MSGPRRAPIGPAFCALSLALLFLGGCLVLENTSGPSHTERSPYTPTDELDVTTRGAVEPIVWPRSVRRGEMESSDFIRLFQEVENATPDPPRIRLDVTRPGTYGATSDLTPGRRTLDYANSYFLTFDPVGRAPETLVREATFVFPQPVIGLCVHEACLERLSRPSALGDPGADYDTSAGHGVEVGAQVPSGNYDSADYLILEDDRRTLHVSFHAGSSLDQLRVVTRGTRGDGPLFPQLSSHQR